MNLLRHTWVYAFVLCIGVGVVLAQDTPSQPVTTTFIVSAPDQDGRIYLAAAAQRILEDELTIVRIDVSRSSEVVVSDGIDGQAIDVPESGSLYRYELRRASEVLATHSLDLRRFPILTFVGGTSKRAVFEHRFPTGSHDTFTIKTGEPIRFDKLKDSGGVISISADAVLESVKVKEHQTSTWQTGALQVPGKASIKGIDGRDLQIELPQVSGEKSFLAVAYVNYKGVRHRLVEGEELELRAP